MSGGVERRRLELARRLDPAEFHQRLVCLNGRPDVLAAYKETGMHVENLKLQLSPAALARAAAAAVAFQPQIVHAAVFEGLWLGSLAALVARAPHLILEEIDYPLHRSWRGNLALRTLALRADVCVGVSPAVVDYLRDTAKIPEHKARLIMNGVREPVFPPASERAELRRALGIPEDRIVIGSVGRLLDSHKRFTTLMAAVRTLTERHPRLHLLIVGAGTDRELLERRRAELGLEHYVTFSGYESSVGRALRVMDLFALVSERESFGLALVEAMYAGLPVVATRVGGIPSIVNHEETGLLVPVDDVSAIASSLDRLLSDAELRARFGNAGRERAHSHFSAERYVGDVAELYRELMTSPKSS